jgi:5-methylthioadenosine/S-adenosylhomocysteine deaminase
MQPFDLTIVNGMMLTLDAQDTIIERGWVGIRGDRIDRIGSGSPPQPAAAKIIDAAEGLVLPGLINGHTHAAMTLFRGLADDLPLMDWLNGFIFPVESRMDADFVYTGARLACAEMIRSGTTTFCDMYLFENEVARAAAESGLRCLVGEVLYDFPSPNYGPIENGFAYTQHLIDSWRGHPLVSIAVEPHSLYTCSPELLQQADDLARREGVPAILHLSETHSEIQQIKDTYGCLPVDHMASLGILGPHLIADHAVHLAPAEMDLLAKNGVKVVHNPESNMKLASGVAPVPEMAARGIPIGLGTDGCASNNDLDLFSEMDTAAKIHKVHRGDPTAMGARQVLRMATAEGAEVLGMGGDIGSLEPGKKADIIVVDITAPHLQPLYNPYSHLVYAASGSDVCHSVVNGRVLMENRRLVTMDQEEVMALAVDKSRLVRRWIGADDA